MGSRSALRILAAAVGLLFLAGTLFQLLDQFDLVAQPPPGLDAANLVDRRLALAPYRQAIWPVFLLENGLVAGFLALTGVGTRSRRDQVRYPTGCCGRGRRRLPVAWAAGPARGPCARRDCAAATSSGSRCQGDHRHRLLRLRLQGTGGRQSDLGTDGRRGRGSVRRPGSLAVRRGGGRPRSEVVRRPVDARRVGLALLRAGGGRSAHRDPPRAAVECGLDSLFDGPWMSPFRSAADDGQREAAAAR